MDYSDLIVNIIESGLYAYLTASYIEIKGKKRIIYLISFTVFLTMLVSFFNLITIYEGLLSASYILFDLIFMFTFDDRIPRFNSVIYAIILEKFVSLGSEIVFLFFHLAYHLTPMEVLTNIDGTILFIFSRSVIFILMLVINKLSEKHKLLQTQYDSFFAMVFLVLFFIITSLENLIVDGIHFVMLIMINLALFVITFFIYYIYGKTSMDYFKNMQLEKLSASIKSVQSANESFAQKEKEIRRMKHDLSNQMSIIFTYLQTGNTEKAMEYIQDNIQELKDMQVLYYSGYTAIDAILSNKFSKAQEAGIHVNFTIHLEQIDTDMEYDIAIILGNLLDNAIENIATKKKEIDLKITQKDFIQIQIKNTTDKQELNLNTQKKDVLNHGIGLSTVELVANKHNGFSLADLANQIFQITVVLHTD